MKSVLVIVLFSVIFVSCNSSSGTTTCMVEIPGSDSLLMYDHDEYGSSSKRPIPTEVRVRKGMADELKPGQSVWLYKYYNGQGKASDWIIVKENRYSKDTTIIEEVVPNYSSKQSYYKKAKFLHF